MIVFCELSVVFSTDSTNLEFLSSASALIGFKAAHKKVHESAMILAEELCTRIRQLSQLSSPNPSSCFTLNGCLVTNACYDLVHQVVVILEELRSTIEDTEDMQVGDLYSKFHHRVDLLLGIGKTMEDLYEILQNSIPKYISGSLRGRIK